MQGFLRSSLVFLLIACTGPRPSKELAEAAGQLTRAHVNHALEASVAGEDCRVLLIRIAGRSGKELVESIHYGTGDYGAFGGVEEFAQERRFRAVVYRDSKGLLRTYGATSRNEAKELAECD